MNKELYEVLVKPNVVELDNRINKIDMDKAEGKIEEYDYQKQLYNVLTEKFNIIEDIALNQVNKNVKEFEENEVLKNEAEKRINQYDKLENQVKNSYLKILKSLNCAKDIKNELDKLDSTGIEIYKNYEDIKQINRNIETHNQEYTSNLPDVERTFLQKIGYYFSKERREYIKVLKDYQKMIKIHANGGNKLVKKQYDIEKNLLSISNIDNIEEKEFIDSIKIDEITIKIMNDNKEGKSNEKYILETIGSLFEQLLKIELDKCAQIDSAINDNNKYIDYNNIYEKIEFAKLDVTYDVNKINDLEINKANFEIKEKIEKLQEMSEKSLLSSNKTMIKNINQILDLLNDIPKEKKNEYEQFIAKMCGQYPELIQK